MPARLPLGNFVAGGRRFAGLVDGDRVLELPVASTAPLLDAWDAATEGLPDGPEHALAKLEVQAPVQPRQILQAGANYRRHVIELVIARGDHTRAEAEALMDTRARSGRPFIFTGLPSALCGPYDDVLLPGPGDHDWELELAVVIGRPARHVSREAALSVVAGYTICNDLTTRNLVFRDDIGTMGADWLAAKNAPTFLPTGPYFVPAELIGDPMNLQVCLTLNGQVMQDESTADMIYDVAALIAHASRCAQLWPGDLLLTGSPAGNGAHWGRYLTDGDVMEGSVTGLGTQRNRCVLSDDDGARAAAPAAVPR